MHRRLFAPSVMGLFALGLLACPLSRTDEQAANVDFGHEPDYSLKRRSADPLPDAGTLDQRGGIVVPPDRALVRIELEVRADSYAAAGDRIREAGRVVIDRLVAEDGCKAVVVDYPAAAPAAQSSWRTQAVVELDIDLGGKGALDQRMEQVESCMSRFEGLDSDKEGPLAGVDVRVSAPLVTVDDLDQHRQDLLQRRFAVLEEVALAQGQPPQFDAGATRCTSTGEVSIAQRSLAGVRVVVDLRCEPRFGDAATIVSPTTVPSGVPTLPHHDPDPFPGSSKGM